MGQLIDKIKAISKIKEHEGKLQIGVLFAEKEGWRNIQNTEEKLKDLLKDTIQKGNTISYDFKDGIISNINLMEKSSFFNKESEEKSWSEDIVTYETLLNEAHSKFDNFSIHTEMIEFNIKEKWAVVHATITIDGEKTQIFQAHGDATQENCQSQMIKPHFIRMAETRAIARALRWACNNAKTAEEEKGA